MNSDKVQKTTFNKPELRLDLILNNGDSVGVKFNINDSTEDNDQKFRYMRTEQISWCNHMDENQFQLKVLKVKLLCSN